MTTETTKTETTKTETTDERNARWADALVRAIHKIRRRAIIDRILAASGIASEIVAYIAANRWAGDHKRIVATLLREAKTANVVRHYSRGENSYSWASDAKLAKVAAEAEALREEDRLLTAKIARAQDALRAAGFTVNADPTVSFTATFEGLHFNLLVVGGR